MKTLAYCMASQADVVWRATGTHPVTCPPFDYRTFDTRVMEQARFVWLGLHGMTTDPHYLYGNSIPSNPFPIKVKALYAGDIRDLNLEGVVVYASVCHFTDTKFPYYFKKAGATVIGGPGENYGRDKGVAGADKLGMLLLKILGDVPRLAVDLALERAKEHLTDSQMEVDAREFKVL
jgi:hypothetical protein